MRSLPPARHPTCGYGMVFRNCSGNSDPVTGVSSSGLECVVIGVVHIYTPSMYARIFKAGLQKKGNAA